ncbi:hypothetical protein PIROE2DRAFT_11335 [Piromyces sp. E2]|nr:hypothetical protein PIROE2DRAFT_11335 [Piromyces sp. E2]|eukprot:OUM62380.1 hypothetical protein PIROE2DRAFT_11335 [Piromyces sp. E2]
MKSDNSNPTKLSNENIITNNFQNNNNNTQMNSQVNNYTDIPLNSYNVEIQEKYDKLDDTIENNDNNKEFSNWKNVNEDIQSFWKENKMNEKNTNKLLFDKENEKNFNKDFNTWKVNNYDKVNKFSNLEKIDKPLNNIPLLKPSIPNKFKILEKTSTSTILSRVNINQPTIISENNTKLHFIPTPTIKSFLQENIVPPTSTSQIPIDKKIKSLSENNLNNKIDKNNNKDNMNNFGFPTLKWGNNNKDLSDISKNNYSDSNDFQWLKIPKIDNKGFNFGLSNNKEVNTPTINTKNADSKPLSNNDYFGTHYIPWENKNQDRTVSNNNKKSSQPTVMFGSKWNEDKHNNNNKQKSNDKKEEDKKNKNKSNNLYPQNQFNFKPNGKGIFNFGEILKNDKIQNNKSDKSNSQPSPNKSDKSNNNNNEKNGKKNGSKDYMKEYNLWSEFSNKFYNGGFDNKETQDWAQTGNVPVQVSYWPTERPPHWPLTPPPMWPPQLPYPLVWPKSPPLCLPPFPPIYFDPSFPLWGDPNTFKYLNEVADHMNNFINNNNIKIKTNFSAYKTQPSETKQNEKPTNAIFIPTKRTNKPTNTHETPKSSSSQSKNNWGPIPPFFSPLGMPPGIPGVPPGMPVPVVPPVVPPGSMINPFESFLPKHSDNKSNNKSSNEKTEFPIFNFPDHRNIYGPDSTKDTKKSDTKQPVNVNLPMQPSTKTVSDTKQLDAKNTPNTKNVDTKNIDTKNVHETKQVHDTKQVQDTKQVDTKQVQDTKVTPETKTVDTKAINEPKKIDNRITLKAISPKMLNETQPAAAALPKGGNQKINTKVLSSASVHGDSDNSKNHNKNKNPLTGNIFEQIKDAPVETVVMYFAPFVAISLFVMALWIFKRKKSTSQKMNQILKDLDDQDNVNSHSKGLIPRWNDEISDKSLSDNGVLTDEQLFRIGNGENIEDVYHEDSNLKNLIIPGTNSADVSMADSPTTLHDKANDELSFSIPIYNLGDENLIHTDSKSIKTIYSGGSSSPTSEHQKSKMKHIKNIFGKKKKSKKSNNEKYVRTLAVLDNQTALPSVNVTQFTGKDNCDQKPIIRPPTPQSRAYASTNGTNNTEVTMINREYSTRSRANSNDSPRTIPFTAQSDQTMYNHNSNPRHPKSRSNYDANKNTNNSKIKNEREIFQSIIK